MVTKVKVLCNDFMAPTCDCTVGRLYTIVGITEEGDPLPDDAGPYSVVPEPWFAESRTVTFVDDVGDTVDCWLDEPSPGNGKINVALVEVASEDALWQ